jgi:hypothetical protein
MSIKVEGTIILEGLIEGPMPPFPDAREKLDRWARQVAGGAVLFSVQVEAGHFSALPSNEPLPVKALLQSENAGSDPSNVIADALSDLLRILPPPARSQVFSTLRTMEYRPSQEVQTLYAIGPDGRAVTRQQTVPAKTLAAEQPIHPRELVKRGGLGLLIAIVVLLVSSFFVDYRGLWRRFTGSVQPATVHVNAGTFAPYFQLQITGFDRRNGTLLVKLTRTPRYPQNEPGFDTLYADPSVPAPTTPATSTAPAAAPAPGPSLLRRRLAVESLVKGLVRIDMFDRDNHLLARATLDVTPLESHEELLTQIPVPSLDNQYITPDHLQLLPD